MRMLGSIAFIALRDSRHEWPMSLLAVVAVVAVVTPLLVLLSMRNGVLAAISSELRSDPRLLEVRIVARGGYSPEDLAAISDWPEVGFLVPRTRFLASNVTLVAETESGPSGLVVTLVPTAAGDPLLRDVTPPASADEIVVAEAVAGDLEISAGDTVTAIVRYEAAAANRSGAGDRHIERRTLRVTGILPARLDQREAVYAPLAFLRNVEAMTEGRPVPQWGWPGRVQAETVETFASFRVFAVSMEHVAALQERLRGLGLEPRSRLAEIETFQALHANLTRLMLYIYGLAGIGVVLSTAVGQYAAVLRKRGDLCLLMLLGYTQWNVAMLPLVSAALFAVLGVALGGLLYALVAPLVDHGFAGRLLPGSSVTQLAIGDLALCVCGTLAISVLASGFAARRVTRLAPSEGLRDE